MSLLERVYFLHQQLSENRYPNSRTLMEEFEVSLPTARRDFAYLRDRLLAPIEFDQQKNGFYYTQDEFSLPFENSPRIIFLLGMLGRLAGSGCDQSFDQRWGRLEIPGRWFRPRDGLD